QLIITTTGFPVESDKIINHRLQLWQINGQNYFDLSIYADVGFGPSSVECVLDICYRSFLLILLTTYQAWSPTSGTKRNVSSSIRSKSFSPTRKIVTIFWNFSSPTGITNSPPYFNCFSITSGTKGAPAVTII